MATSKANKVEIRAEASETPPSPMGGEVTANRAIVNTYPAGGASGQVNRVLRREITIPASSTVAIDLQTELDRFDQALDLDGVAAIEVVADPSNADVVSVQPSGANGWVGVISAGGVDVQPGLSWGWRCGPEGTDGAVTGAAKSLDLVNAAGSSADVTLVILGRT